MCHNWDIAPQAAIELAVECETAARREDARLTNSDGSLVGTYSGSHLYGNTHGFINGWDWSSHNIDCTVIAEENGRMQRDGWYTKARDRRDLESVESVGREAARRTLSRLNARNLATRTAPVIFEAPVARGLFSAFIGAISGGALYRRASFLLDKLGRTGLCPTDTTRGTTPPPQRTGQRARSTTTAWPPGANPWSGTAYWKATY